jgi:DNA polymerase III subunit delta
MKITSDQLRERLRRREVAPAYTLFGEAEFLRDNAVKYIADLCFGEGDLREFNEAEYSLDQPDNIGHALAAAVQLPMMAAKRVIRVKGLVVAAAANRDTLREEAEPLLVDYLNRPSESTVLILIADELNANRKLGKLLLEKTLAVDFAGMDGRSLREWTAKQIREAGADADPRTINYLLDAAGTDVRRISNETRKLAAASLPEGKITADLIDALVPFTREISNFDLTDDLVAGRRADALRSLKRLFDNGTEPLALLGLISSNYRRLLIASEMLSRGVPRHEIASAAKLFGAGRDALLSAAQRIGPKELVRAIERIAKTDLAIKTSVGGSGPAAARMQLEMLVCELAQL